MITLLALGSIFTVEAFGVMEVFAAPANSVSVRCQGNDQLDCSKNEAAKKKNLPMEFFGKKTSAEIGSGAGLLTGYIKTVYDYLAVLISVVAVVMIVIGGVQIMLGGVSSEAVSNGKNLILGTLSGVALFFMLGLLLHTIMPGFFTS